MRLLREKDVPPESGETVFRPSVLKAAVPFAVFLALTLLAAGWYAGRLLDGPVSWRVHAPGLWFTFWAAVFLAFAWALLRAALRPSGWRVRFTPGRLLVNFRSSLNHRYSDEDSTVVELQGGEIAWVRETREGAVYLDLKLALPPAEAERLAAALREERDREIPGREAGRRIFEARKSGQPRAQIELLRSAAEDERRRRGGRGLSSKWDVRLVSLIDPGILRVTWNGMDCSVGKALKILRTYWPVERKTP